MSGGSQALWFGCSMKSQSDQSSQFITSKIKVGIQVTLYPYFCTSVPVSLIL